MTRKKRPDTSFADTVARMKSEPAAARTPWPRTTRLPSETGHLMFDGTHWHRTRTNIDQAEALALLVAAHLVLKAEGGGYKLTRVPDADRQRTWVEIRDRFNGPGGTPVGPDWSEEPLYTADRFEDDHSRTLLYIETHC